VLVLLYECVVDWFVGVGVLGDDGFVLVGDFNCVEVFGVGLF